MIRKLIERIKRVFLFRDARTGRFVSKDYASRNESTTTKERMK